MWNAFGVAKQGVEAGGNLCAHRTNCMPVSIDPYFEI